RANTTVRVRGSQPECVVAGAEEERADADLARPGQEALIDEGPAAPDGAQAGDGVLIGDDVQRDRPRIAGARDRGRLADQEERRPGRSRTTAAEACAPLEHGRAEVDLE